MTMPRRGRSALLLGAMAAMAVAAFLLSLVLGSTRVPVRDVLSVLAGVAVHDSGTVLIVETIRLPRAITAMLSGAALGLAGLQMQTLFRNPLADPFALGVSSGASLGVALVVLGTSSGAAAAFGSATGLAGDALVTAAAIAGATAVLALVLAISARVASATTVLVLGLMFGYAVSACVTVLIGTSEPQRLQQWVQWGFGSFSGVTRERLGLFAATTAAGAALAVCSTKQLNALLLGEQYARSMGMSVRRARLAIMLGASTLGAVVTAYCGPISFLGIAVPHVCRGVLRTADHRLLVPAVALTGAAAALTAQVVAVLPPDGILPLNAVTSIMGAPIVIALLLRRHR